MTNKSTKFATSCYVFLLVVYLNIKSHGFMEYKSILDEHRMLPKAKGTIKTIESPEDGVVIDCIDFWAQPAFDNPIIKKLQVMERTKYSYSDKFQTKNTSKLSNMYHKWQKYGECPKGTIPVRRTRSENATNIHRGKRRTLASINFGDGNNHEYAVAHYPRGEYNGIGVVLNVWNPSIEVGGNEFSVAQVWVASNIDNPELINTVEAGWIVDRRSPNYKARVFVECTSDGYNTRLDCKRDVFVRDNQNLSFDCDLAPSVYDEDQYELKVDIFRDQETRAWVLFVDNAYVGYWPTYFFEGGTLGNGAEMLQWGGEVINNWKDGFHTITEMGSGLYPEEGYRRAAYMRTLLVKDVNHNWINARRDLLGVVITYPGCYTIKLGPDSGLGPYGPDTTVYFGGPGGKHCSD